MIVVELVSSGATFAAMRAEWTRLHDESAAGVFLSWEWLYASWRRVDPGRLLRLVIARDAGGRLVGALPLSEERHPGGARVWRFLGDRSIGSDYLDCLAPRGAEREVGRTLWSAVVDDDGYDVLEVLDLDEGSPSRDVLRAAAARRALAHEERARYRCPVLSLGGSAAELRERFPRRENLRRRRRWFERQAGYEIAVAESPAALGGPLDDFFHLHELRWAPAGGSEAITGADVEGFHRDATQLLGERGMVRMYTLRVGDRPLASLYLLRRARYRAMYQCGYDPAFARHSPGLVLLARSIEDAIAEGAAEYDFLRGVEPYKLEWANGERRTIAVRVARHTPAGLLYLAARAATAAGRRCAKQVLPGPVVGWARRLVGHAARGLGSRA